MKSDSEKEPLHHTRKIEVQLTQLVEHLREDVGKVTDPKAQALFETSAEVLIGLAKAFGDYEKKSEEAWASDLAKRQPIDGAPHASRR